MAGCVARTRSGRASGGPTCSPNSDRQATPVILLTSHLPRPGTDGDRALHAATADAFFDAIEMYDLEGQGRLQAYAKGERRPVVGFWTAKEIEDSRRWASP